MSRRTVRHDNGMVLRAHIRLMSSVNAVQINNKHILPERVYHFVYPCTAIKSASRKNLQLVLTCHKYAFPPDRHQQS